MIASRKQYLIYRISGIRVVEVYLNYFDQWFIGPALALADPQD